MPELVEKIRAVIDSAPADLVSYYVDGDMPTYPDSRINCLSFEDAQKYNRSVLRNSAIGRLGLWILDDANDSDPYAYISKGPCAGAIIHFSHNSEPTIAFSSLRTFLIAMHDAGARGLDIDELTKDPVRISLDREVHELTEEQTEDATFLITVYLPVAASLRKETKDRLASHEDFFVRETFANFLSQNASVENRSYAERLSADQHPQVVRAGTNAIAAIRRKTTARPAG